MRKYFITVLLILVGAPSLSAQWEQMDGKQGGDSAGLLTTLGNRLFAAVDNSLFSTIDDGDHWVQVDTPVSLSQSVEELVVRDTDLFATLSGGDICSLYRSTDQGNSWSFSKSLADGAMVVANNNLLFESGGWASEGIYRSLNGISWDDIDSNVLLRGVNQLALNDNIVCAIVSFPNTNNYSLIVSADFGTSWQAGTLPDAGIYSIAVVNASIHLGTSHGIFRSDDLGATWSVVDTFSDAQMFQVKENWVVAASPNQGIIVSSDFGYHWSSYNEGLPGLHISAIAIGDTEIYAALTSGGIFHSKFPSTNSQTDVGCSLSAWVLQQQPHSTGTPSTLLLLRDTIITVNGTEQSISIPDGFTMSVFATVPQARGLALSQDGVIYATAYNGDVYALPDHNHDGIADSTIMVASGLNDPHGIGFYDGNLYVSNNANLWRFVTDPLTRKETSMVQIAALPSAGGHHSRNFVFDTIDKKIYLQIGSNGNIDTTDIAHRAQIVEMNPDGSGYRSFATGVRNAVGMDLDPRTGALWVNNNGMDDIFGSGTSGTANNPCESIYLVCDGANYGWPWCYGFRLRNPLMLNLDTSVVQTFDGPVGEVEAHSAPLGLHFYRGTKLPALYHNAIFQCYHGSWDRTPPAPPRVTVMWADTDGKNARIADFVTGFMVPGRVGDSNTGYYFGRPVSIIEGADSALYVSDDQESVVYRINYTGVASNVGSNESSSSRLSLANPNPAENAVNAMLSLRVPEHVRIDLLNEIGEQMASFDKGEMPPGNQSFTFDTSSLPAGTYILRVTAGSDVESRRFVIER
ncbi:MAG TPA: PQQ-dependent sugar dehydrogenase [Candidatus Kapabacteria bacterium]|jgi:glucose/arabinose dehydrogenase